MTAHVCSIPSHPSRLLLKITLNASEHTNDLGTAQLNNCSNAPNITGGGQAGMGLDYVLRIVILGIEPPTPKSC